MENVDGPAVAPRPRGELFTVNAFGFLAAKRYDKAITEFREAVRLNPNNWPAVAGLARALQCAGEHQEAVYILERIDRWERMRTPGHPGRAKDIACSLWCMGERTRASGLVRDLAKAAFTGNVRFTDKMAAAQPALLFYYMSTVRYQNNRPTEAISYLRALVENPRFREWPTVLIRHVLGEFDFGTLLSSEFGVRDIMTAKELSKTKSTLPRKLCLILFYAATRKRVDEDSVACIALMDECASLPNPLVEPEWLLARNEVEVLRG